MKKSNGFQYILTAAALVAAVLLAGEHASAQEKMLKIESKAFPDVSLYEYAEEKADLNEDGYLSAEEMDKVTELYLEDVTELTGIEHFENLKLLYWTGQLQKEPDLRKNKKLKTLVCYSYNLSRIDLSENTELTEITMRDAKITSLDLSKQTKLKRLNLAGSKSFKKLDVSMCPNLEKLFVRHCGLKVLKLGKKEKLDSLDCAYNQLRPINTKKLPALCYLDMAKTLDKEEPRFAKILKKKVPLTKKYFPDSVLRSELKEGDTNKDGKLSKKEIKKIRKLRLDYFGKKSSHRWRVDLAGLQYLTSLDSLTLSEVTPENQVALKMMNVKKICIEGGIWNDLRLGNKHTLESMEVVDCEGLNTVALNYMPKLTRIYMEGCDIQRLLLGRMVALQDLEVDCPQLREFEAKKLWVIRSLILPNNALTELDLSGCKNSSKKKIEVVCDKDVEIVKKKKLKIAYESTEDYLGEEK
nr:hypothetical protein [Eubacterium sp.]